MEDLTPISNDLPNPRCPGLDLFVQIQMLATIFSAVTYGIVFTLSWTCIQTLLNNKERGPVRRQRA